MFGRNVPPEASFPALAFQRRTEAAPQGGGVVYFLFAFFHFAQRLRCAAAILLRADADMMRFTRAEPVVFAAAVAGCEPFRTFFHLAFCASAIFRRELSDMIRVGCFVVRDSPELFNDSITEIARSNFST